MECRPRMPCPRTLAPLQTVFHTLIQMVDQFKLVDENLVSLLFSSAFPSSPCIIFCPFSYQVTSFLITLISNHLYAYLSHVFWLSLPSFIVKRLSFVLIYFFMTFQAIQSSNSYILLSHMDNFRFWLVISLLFVNDVRWRPKGLPKRVAK